MQISPSLGNIAAQTDSASLCTRPALAATQNVPFSGVPLYPFTVGYAQKDTAASGFAMLSAQFESIGSVDGSAKLSDLTVGGYAPYDEVEDEGGTSGSFRIQFLSSSGTMEAQYFWYDDDEKTGWFDKDGNAAADIAIGAAKGLWVRGAGLSMTSAGTVNASDIVVPTASSGFKAIGNTFPTDVTLSRLAITGYAPYDEMEDEGGTSGSFRIQFLTSSGTMEAQYFWYDDDEKTGWFDKDGNAAGDVTIAAGTGVWVRGGGLTMRIPAPEF